MALNTQLRNITEVLARDVSEGRASRASLGGQAAAFGWTGGLPITLASFVETAQSEGMSIPITKIAPSGTPAAKVAEGAAKPLAVAITAGSVQLQKFAGYGELTIEQVLGTAGMVPAVSSVLGAGSLLAFEADAMAVLDAGNGDAATGTTWLAAITSAQGKVVAAGGNPGVLVLSAADYATVVGELSGSAGFVTDPRSPVGAYFGSAVHVSPKLAAGKAFVLDPAGVLAIEHKESPVVIVDPFGNIENKIRVVTDLFAATTVTNPGVVVEVTKGAVQSSTSKTKKDVDLAS